jgi:cell division protease FtsH
MRTSYYLSSSNASNPESSLDTLRYAITRAKHNGKTAIEKEDVLASYRIDVKLAKRMNLIDKKATAYHEAGHYIVRRMSENIKIRENAFVSIIPIGETLGLNADYFKFENQTSFNRDYYIDNIAYCLGGRIAEKEYIKSETSGASADLVTATSLAEKLVLSYGLSEESSKNRSYTNGECLKTFLFTDDLRKEMNKEINDIISEAYSRAEKIIKENADLLEKIVEQLLKDGILTGDELDVICKNSDS